MKKTLILLLLLMLMVNGCASSAAAPSEPSVIENEEEPIEETVVTEEPLEETALPEEPEEEPEDYSQGLEVMDMGTVGFEDFAYAEYLNDTGVPEEAEYPPAKDMEGRWKYRLFFSEEALDGNSFTEIGFADLSVDYDKDIINMTLDPRYANDGYETWPESAAEVGYAPFSGTVTDENTLKFISGYTIIVINGYFTYEGLEYALGEIWISEESGGTFLMTRAGQARP